MAQQREIDDMRCDNCDDALDLSTWTPTTVEDGDENVEIYRFCSEECREQWKD